MYDILVDIDGTIADCTHRIHHIQPDPNVSYDADGYKGYKNWDAFHDAAIHDSIIEDVLNVIKMLQMAGCRIIMCTARGEENREATELWLKEKAKLKYDALYMRAKGDYRPDSICKPEMLEQITKDGYNPVMVFEDRKGVTNAWRERGLRVFQVVEGDY